MSLPVISTPEHLKEIVYKCMATGYLSIPHPRLCCLCDACASLKIGPQRLKEAASLDFFNSAPDHTARLQFRAGRHRIEILLVTDIVWTSTSRE